jgi:hypothetical protein
MDLNYEKKIFRTLFLKAVPGMYQAMKMYGVAEIWLYSFSTSALDGG